MGERLKNMEQERLQNQGQLSGASNSATPTTPADLTKHIITALFSIADGPAKKKVVKDLFGNISGADIDQLHNSADDPDLGTFTQHGITPDLYPPQCYGDARMDNKAIKWLREKLTLKRTTKKTLNIEDFLSLFRRLQLHFDSKFSKSTLAETIIDTLPDNMAKTFKDSFYKDDGTDRSHRGESLSQAWLATLLRHRNRPTPEEATATLTKMVTEFDTDVIEQLENIREQAGFTSGGTSAQINLALIYARMYLTNLGLDTFTLKNLTSPTTSVDKYMDAFTSLFQSAKAAKKELETLRLNLASPKTATVKAISTSDTIKEKAKLTSQMGQLVKQMDQMSIDMANQVAHLSAMAVTSRPLLYQNEAQIPHSVLQTPDTDE